MTDKLLHVSLIVRDTGLYDLLAAIEPHRVANLEVRAVAPQLALPAPAKSTAREGSIRYLIESSIAIGAKFAPISIAVEHKVPRQSVYSEVARMIARKQAKRLSYGNYQRLT